MLRNVLIFLVLPSLILTRQIPSYVHLCRKNDPKVAECFLNTVNEIMPHLLEGIPEMDIPPIDPLTFDTIKVDTGSGSSVNLVVNLLNGTVSGLRDIEIKDHVMDFDKVQFTASIHIPRIQIDSTYTMKGKILLFELNGHGHATFNATDITTRGIWYGSTFMKKNKKHIRIDDIVFNDVDIQGISVNLENLFENNQAFTDTVNKAVNDNIDSLKEELEPLIKKTLTEIIRDYFNRVYRLFPMDQLFPED